MWRELDGDVTFVRAFSESDPIRKCLTVSWHELGVVLVSSVGGRGSEQSVYAAGLSSKKTTRAPAPPPHPPTDLLKDLIENTPAMFDSQLRCWLRDSSLRQACSLRLPATETFSGVVIEVGWIKSQWCCHKMCTGVDYFQVKTATWAGKASLSSAAPPEHLLCTILSTP